MMPSWALIVFMLVFTVMGCVNLVVGNYMGAGIMFGLWVVYAWLLAEHRG